MNGFELTTRGGHSLQNGEIALCEFVTCLGWQEFWRFE